MARLGTAFAVRLWSVASTAPGPRIKLGDRQAWAEAVLNTIFRPVCLYKWELVGNDPPIDPKYEIYVDQCSRALLPHVLENVYSVLELLMILSNLRPEI